MSPASENIHSLHNVWWFWYILWINNTLPGFQFTKCALFVSQNVKETKLHSDHNMFMNVQDTHSVSLELADLNFFQNSHSHRISACCITFAVTQNRARQQTLLCMCSGLCCILFGSGRWQGRELRLELAIVLKVFLMAIKVAPCISQPQSNGFRSAGGDGMPADFKTADW